MAADLEFRLRLLPTTDRIGGLVSDIGAAESDMAEPQRMTRTRPRRSGFSRALPSALDLPVPIILRREFVHVDEVSRTTPSAFMRRQSVRVNEVLIFRDGRSFPPRFIRQESVRVNNSFYLQEFRPNSRPFRHQEEYVLTGDSFILRHFEHTTVRRAGARRGGNTDNISNSARKVVNLTEVRIEEEENNCSICLEGMCRGQRAGQLPCTHVFHKECIGRWLKDSTACPLCRAPAVIDASATTSINT